jgi:hypothetical protein
MDAFSVSSTLLRAPRRRAYNLSRYKLLLRISLFFWRAPPNQLRPAEAAECRKIILRHVPRLQGESFPGLLQHQRKFSDVASLHHFLCLLGRDLQRKLGESRNRSLTSRSSIVQFLLKRPV